MSDPKQNPLPQDDQLRALYRRLPADEPTAELDEVILTAARQHARADGQARGGRRAGAVRRLRWALPMAAAAGLVLTVARLLPEQPAMLAERATSAESVDEPSRQDFDGLDIAELGFRDRTAPGVAQQEAIEAGEKAGRDKPDGKAGPISKAKKEGASEGEPNRAFAEPLEERQAAAPPPAAQRKLSSLKSLGYMEGDDTAAAAIDRARRDSASAADSALEAEETPAALPQTETQAAWPFGLEPGLSAEETCRRVTEATGGQCRFFTGFAELLLSPPVAVDRGDYAGSNVSRLTLGLRNGGLTSVELGLREADGSTTSRSLPAPRAPSPRDAGTDRGDSMR